ncbi:unnamed protein product [Vitrella brassicaformis CCMP3155]|uniref:RING-CH-type domain-containing protein n=1 Tax=Vitrella brassicaformis (strain CCMP3155) TaxID=1169540 RepID=A0A0G4EPU2_VITBC|nr:unnamed protein product [Vitrella brassicaformis CCMP3155]|mmetsp:Transcript_4368/g.10013  ORF Transcript_4368/g.10013 Transcript_4368/m.10013 type:complete len:756 (-) Transcript_4368:71-2338(-)|eukprot:CEL99854.1 unnamed protein product [Vitrella brassicaformis CCMP3155]
MGTVEAVEGPMPPTKAAGAGSQPPSGRGRPRGCTLVVRSATWGNDSHGLFDYESRNLHKKTFKVTGTGPCLSFRAVRVGTDVQLLSEQEAIELAQTERTKTLMRIAWEDGAYSISQADKGSGGGGSDKLWMVVRSLKTQGVKLTENDVIKLGRFKLKVKEVVATPSQADAAIARASHRPDDDEIETVAPAEHEHEEEPSGGHPEDMEAHSSLNPSPMVREPPQETSDTEQMDAAPDRDRDEGQVTHRSAHSSAAYSYLSVSPVAATTFTPMSNANTAVTAMTNVTAVPPTNRAEGEDVTPVSTLGGQQTTAGGDDSRKATNDEEAVQLVRLLGALPTRRSPTNGQANICRICLSEGGEAGNPLISPCRCKGSMRFVHLHCLRTWMEGRLNIRQQDGTHAGAIFWRTLDCELCKTPYPTFVEADHKSIELFAIPRPEYPYLMLEVMMRHRNPHTGHAQAGRGLHIISLAHRKIAKMGRGHDSEVRISDISVSRCHATLRFHRGCFILEDHFSKFGTLVALKKPFRLDVGNTISVQVGRTVLTVQVKRSWRLLPGCFRRTHGVGTDVVTTDQPIGNLASNDAASGQRRHLFAPPYRFNGNGRAVPFFNNRRRAPQAEDPTPDDDDEQQQEPAPFHQQHPLQLALPAEPIMPMPIIHHPHPPADATPPTTHHLAHQNTAHDDLHLGTMARLHLADEDEHGHDDDQQHQGEGEGEHESGDDEGDGVAATPTGFTPMAATAVMLAMESMGSRGLRDAVSQ